MSRRKRQNHRGAPPIPVIDLFAGPGGLSEGFCAPRETGGSGRFRIALSIEKDERAHQTLELRALFRQFGHGDAPEVYYRFLRGDLTRNDLFLDDAIRECAVEAATEAWRVELGAIDERAVDKRLRLAVQGEDDCVLIGGPPCQAYSLVGRSRNQGNPDYDATKDGRHTLYREYLKVIAARWPAVFVMENVKGLLSARVNNEPIFARILEDLSDPAKAIRGAARATRRGRRYRILALSSGTAPQLDFLEVPADPRRYVVRSEDFGVPQARHRLILLGVREDIGASSDMGLHLAPRVTTGMAISDLPPLRSGVSTGDDDASRWRDIVEGSVKTGWFAQLRSKDADVARAVAESAAEAVGRDLTRGGEYTSVVNSVRLHRHWYYDPNLRGILHHATRAHIPADIHRYLFASAFAQARGHSPTLCDFPSKLLPHHDNVSRALNGEMFADRFRVQVADRPATTVTSHISKDGHYYIHPDATQCRSLTAREAARLQTFPDNYYFCGGRTAQYHQIGNAVPPLLAVQIAKVVAALLR